MRGVGAKSSAERHVLEHAVVVLLGAHLVEQDQAAFLHVLEVAALDRGPRVGNAAHDLAALHGEVDLGTAGIAGDHLVLHAQEPVHDVAGDHGIRGGAGAARDEHLVVELLVVGEARGVPRHRERGFAGERADPVHLERIELGHGILARDQRFHRDAALGRADERAVLGRHVVEEVRHHQRAAAGHVLRDHGGLARDVLDDVARREAGIAVVAAAGGQADEHGHPLALVEVLDRVGTGRGAGRNENDAGRQRGAGDAQGFHRCPPVGGVSVFLFSRIASAPVPAETERAVPKTPGGDSGGFGQVGWNGQSQVMSLGDRPL